MKNLEELRDFLANELQRVSSGDITPAAANASANLTGKILSSVKLELEYNKMTGHKPDINFLGKTNKDKLQKLENNISDEPKES